MRAELQTQLKALERDLQKNTDEIEAVRAEVGAQSFSLDGHKITRVEGTYKSLDKKLFVTLGGDLKLLDQATVEKPRKPYTKVTMPGQKDDDYGSGE